MSTMPVTLPNLPKRERLVDAEVENATRRRAVGGHFLDAHVLRAVAGERQAQVRPHWRPLCTFHDPEKPISHGHHVAADDLVVPQRRGFLALVAEEPLVRTPVVGLAPWRCASSAPVSVTVAWN